MYARTPTPKPMQIGYHRLVGIMLLVYIKQELYMNVSDVESDFIATGLHGIMVSGGGGIIQCSLAEDGV